MLLTLWLALGTAVLAQAPRAVTPPEAPQDRTATTAAPVVSETAAVQIMLDRSGFSPGEIDGRAGANLARALTAFQRAHGLTASGTLDDATWQQLSQQAGNLPPLVTYAIADSDIAGPFQPAIPEDLVEQARLKTLAYRTALEAIAEKFHVSPRLLQELNAGATFTRAGERILVPNVEPFEPPAREVRRQDGRRGAARGTTGRGGGNEANTARNANETEQPAAVTITVSRAASSLTVADASGRVLFHAPVTSGSDRDPLPLGEWKVTSVHPMPVFNYNPELFWDADASHAKAKIPPGPNNPVGVAWIDLSKEHYGIHGTPEPSRIGHVQSHGCVRLTNWDVARVMQWARPGTRVVFRE